MKKLYFVILFITLLFPKIVLSAGIDLVPDYSWYGNGDKVSYEIISEEQLLGFANIVNGKAKNINKDTFKNKTIYLKEDLDLTGMIWTPIGSSMYDHLPDDSKTKMFEGTFEGEHHTITGLSSENYKALSEDISSGEHSYGLFGYAYGANIKNLMMENVSISCSGEAGADGAGVAAVIGYYVPKDNSPSIIENVHVLSGEVKATNNMGGVIGYMEIKGENVNVDVTIKNTSNAAKVTTDAREAGGILGLFQNSDGDIGSLTFENCINYGEITANPGASSTAAGGILGKEQSHGYEEYKFKVYFENCINRGNVIANGKSGAETETHASGIGTVYYAYGAPVVVNNSINTGNITITGSSKDNFISGIIAHPAIGEVNNEDAIVQNSSYNLGKITAPNSSVIVIQYDVNGASGNEAAVRVSSGKSVTLPTGSNLIRDGFVFSGWNTKIDGSGTHYSSGANVSFEEATTLYAEWRKTKEKWSVSAIPYQVYTGKSIKPNIIVFDENNNIVDSNKYRLIYEDDTNCIDVGKHVVKVLYNNETMELDYEIIKGRVEIEIIPSSTSIKSNEILKVVVKGNNLQNTELLCNDSDVFIKNNGNNTFDVKLPDKDSKYYFTAIAKENSNHFESSASVYVTGTQANEEVVHNPTTGIVSPYVICGIIIFVGVVIFSLSKRKKYM